MSRLSSAILIVILCSFPAWAANHYICAGGTGDGSNWTNCEAMPALDAWVRGDTYYLATGNYSGIRLNLDTASGSGTVTVNKATAANSGAVPGWNAAYGTGQAVIDPGDTVLSACRINIPNVTINGQYRTNSTSGHGIKCYQSYAGASDTNALYFEPGMAISSVSISYVEATTNPSATGINNAVKIAATTQDQISGVTFSYCDFHDASQDIILMRKLDTITIDNCAIRRNLVVGETHGQGISNDCSNNIVITNNEFIDIQSSGQICTGMAETCTSDNWKIYNNLFYKTASPPSPFTSPGGIRAWNGYGTRTGWYIVGNTFYRIGYNDGIQPMIEFPAGSTGNFHYNNIWYQPRDGTNFGLSNVTTDYNAYYGNSGRPDETNKVDLSGYPFVSAGSNFHLSLGAEVIGAGKNDLGSPFSTDKDGVARGAAWDIGAYEYDPGNKINMGAGGTMTIGAGGTITLQ